MSGTEEARERLKLLADACDRLNHIPVMSGLNTADFTADLRLVLTALPPQPTLPAELVELSAALKPFARFTASMERLDQTDEDVAVKHIVFKLKFSDFRRAREAYDHIRALIAGKGD